MTCIFGPVARNIQGYVALVVLWLVKLTSDVKQIRTKTTIIGTSKKDDFTRQFPHQGNNLLFDCSIHIYTCCKLINQGLDYREHMGCQFSNLMCEFRVKSQAHEFKDCQFTAFF